MGTPPTVTANGGARSAASPAAAGARSPNPTQLAAAASASRTRIGILQFSRKGRTLRLSCRGRLGGRRSVRAGMAAPVSFSRWFGGFDERYQARTKRRLPLSHVGEHGMNVEVESRCEFLSNAMDLCDNRIFPHGSASHEFFRRAYDRHSISQRLAH